MFTSARRAHYLFAAALFGVLGFHVGVWAVQLAPLAAGLGLNPARLGAAVTVAAAAGLVTLFGGGMLADRVGRRPVLVIGFAGTGAAFVLVALAHGFAALVPAVMLYGLAVSLVDLGANTVGSAYEQAYDVTAMTGLHAWFSGGALAGALGSAVALSAGVSYRGVYLGLAVVMVVGLLVALFGAMPALPPRARAGTGHEAGPRVWRIPAVLFAIALISVTFFGDGALESFLSSYLQRTLAGGVLLSGFGIGSYQLASLLGRLTATATLRRFGERRVVMAAGLLAAAGLLVAVTAPDAAGAIGGLLLVGFAVAPVVPTTLSLAGRSAPGRSGRAVATATAAGYGAFIVSPLSIGLIAQATNLRFALALLILTSLGIAGLATRWPGSGRLAAGAQPGERSGQRVLGEGAGQVRAEAAGGQRAEPDAEDGTAERGHGRHRGRGLGSLAVACGQAGRGRGGQRDAGEEAPGLEPARGGWQLVGGHLDGAEKGRHDLGRPRAGPGRDDTAVLRSGGQRERGDPGGAARAGSGAQRGRAREGNRECRWHPLIIEGGRRRDIGGPSRAALSRWSAGRAGRR